MLDDVLTSENLTSAFVSGVQLSASGSRAQTTLIAAQVIPSADDLEYVVHLEAAINSNVNVQFTKIGMFESGDEVNMSTFPVAQNVLYRFRRVDENPQGSVTVRLTG